MIYYSIMCQKGVYGYIGKVPTLAAIIAGTFYFSVSFMQYM